MKMAQGYVTEDGTFFESKTEAVLHEAESRLRGELAFKFPEAHADSFLTVIFELRSQMKEYIDAYNAAYPPKPDQAEVEDREETSDSREAESAANIGHVSSTEEDLAALLKLPARGPSHVPDVGSGPRSKEVQERRAEHGSGVRRVDASGVRRRKSVAAKQDTKA
jgi:hypothetical protein